MMKRCATMLVAQDVSGESEILQSWYHVIVVLKGWNGSRGRYRTLERRSSANLAFVDISGRWETRMG